MNFAVLKEAAAGIGALTHLGAFAEQNALSKLVGGLIWDRLFAANPEISSALYGALGPSPRPARLLIRIVSDSDALDVPFELLHDGTNYVGLQQPLVRFLRYAQAGQAPWEQVVSELENRQQPLRILLIAADTCSDDLGLPGIPSVDHEIETVRKIVTGFGGRLYAEVLASWETTEEAVRRKLKEGWHIIHYAGHGTYDSADPDNSALYLWGQPCPKQGWSPVREDPHKAQKLRGELCTLHTPDLRLYFDQRCPALLYLSCCHSARAGHASCLAYSKSLGLVDAAVRAGVPLVVGHRWPPKDDANTISFVRTFYERLLGGYPPEQALLWARKSVSQYEADWASALMVMQSG